MELDQAALFDPKSDLHLSMRAGAGWFFGWAGGSRPHRVTCYILGIWLISGFDLVFTIMSHNHGLLEEQNPVARQVLLRGVESIVTYKLTLVALGTCPLWWFRRERIAELGTLVILTVYAMLAVRWNICYELYTLALTDDVSWIDLDALPRTSGL